MLTGPQEITSNIRRLSLGHSAISMAVCIAGEVVAGELNIYSHRQQFCFNHFWMPLQQNWHQNQRCLRIQGSGAAFAGGR